MKIIIHININMQFSRAESNGYPSVMEVEAAAVMARKISQIHKLFAILSELRRVPPGLIKNFDTWLSACNITNEAGVLMRVAQLSYITKLDVIPNLDKTYTHLANTEMSFATGDLNNDNLFVNNIQITIDVPGLDDCDIHVYETDTSILLKYDTKFKFERCGKDRYTVRLPGFHKLDNRCINKLNLIFSSKEIKHLPITILTEYDYVFIKPRIADVISDILSRYTCIRISDKLAIKYIPAEPNKKVEIFEVEPPPINVDLKREIISSYSLFKNLGVDIIIHKSPVWGIEGSYEQSIQLSHKMAVKRVMAIMRNCHLDMDGLIKLLKLHIPIQQQAQPDTIQQQTQPPAIQQQAQPPAIQQQTQPPAIQQQTQPPATITEFDIPEPITSPIAQLSIPSIQQQTQPPATITEIGIPEPITQPQITPPPVVWIVPRNTPPPVVHHVVQPIQQQAQPPMTITEIGIPEHITQPQITLETMPLNSQSIIVVDRKYDLLHDNQIQLSQVQKDVVDFLYSIDVYSLQFQHNTKNRTFVHVNDKDKKMATIGDVRDFYEKLTYLFEKHTKYKKSILQQYINRVNRYNYIYYDEKYPSIRQRLVHAVMTTKVHQVNVLKGADMIDKDKYDIIIELTSHELDKVSYYKKFDSPFEF